MNRPIRIYLAGAINGRSDKDCKAWRNEAKHLHKNCIDPMDRDYRGRESLNVSTIVSEDMCAIQEADAMMVHYDGPSAGTCMEIFYMAFNLKRPVALIDVSGSPLSPWVAHFITYHCRGIAEAIHRLKMHYGETDNNEVDVIRERNTALTDALIECRNLNLNQYFEPICLRIHKITTEALKQK